ncbi:FtsK/SpoIIIE domain-containing protein [Nesterenkonia halotolerans]|uniref:FtsK/SpoIIIE domain-containing protein n=1 Tax=Nesterenkonia halotolerans TaxID=225325 RepID=UPI003EE4326C
MAIARTEALTCTVVHAPGSVSESVWERLWDVAGGTVNHELRVVAEGLMTPSGDELDQALTDWIHGLMRQELEGASREAQPAATTWAAHLDGAHLSTYGPDSPAIHPGMTVVLHPRARGKHHHPSQTAELRLCVNTGPDSGRLVRLRRGFYTLGRGTSSEGKADIRINDPQLQRIHATLAVGEQNATLRKPGTRPLSIKAGTTFTLGASELELVHGHPVSQPPSSWPIPPENIGERPPQARHRSTLLMSLAPLVVGLVLVFVTGMWIFLLFTVASALMALAMTVHAARVRRRFRRAVEAAAMTWARRRDEVLASPGRAIRLLRAQLAPDNPTVSVEGRGAAVVTVGHARQKAELDSEDHQSASLTLADGMVHSVAALYLAAGEITTVSGSPHEQDGVMRWMLVQLAQRFGSFSPWTLVSRPETAPKPGGAQTLVDPGDLRDWSLVRTVPSQGVSRELSTASILVPGALAPVLLSPVPIDATLYETAGRAGWHVIAPSSAIPDDETPQQRKPVTGWELDLYKGELRRVDPGMTSVIATDLVSDGLSRRSLAEHLRVGLQGLWAPGTSVGTPAYFTRALEVPLMIHRAQDSLRTLIGMGPHRVEMLDIVEDGPHILLAGTTGSGKSELLKSMLLGWASRYGPEELNLILFDFKGGSTFQHIAHLEHCLGLVTDLSQAQAERTLEAVRSELTRRERLFLDAGVSDFAEYRASGHDHHLARILIVIDEFRVFSHSLPRAMEELMRLATLGRSLGLHLVLSTQRPQGVVTADIRANIGTVLCLRLRSEDESRDLVGTTEAALIPRGLPGRGIIRRPGETPTPFQAVQLHDTAAQLSIRSEASQTASVGPRSEATSIVTAALHAAMEHQQRARPHTPLCPPLPEVVTGCVGDNDILLGLVDEPAHQRQRRLNLSVEEGQTIALVGEPESGATEALPALTRQLLTRPQQTHVYLLDGDQSLSEFRSHPRVGAWLSEDDIEEAVYLLNQLQESIAGRRAAEASQRAPIVLVISAHARWHAAGQLPGGAGLEHRLNTLLAECHGSAISAVISGGRELATGRLGSRIARKVYLPYAVPEDTQYLWPKLRVSDPLPGRGVLVEPAQGPPGRTVQIITGVRDLPHPSPMRTRHLDPVQMLRVQALPASVRRSTQSSPPLSLGLKQFSHEPAVLDPQSFHVGLVLGAAGTGKSNALQILAAQERCISPADLGEEPITPSVGSEQLPLLLVDDADRCSLVQHQQVEAWILSGGRVIATAHPSMRVFSQLPWAHRARGGPANFLLSPTSRGQGDVFGMPIPVFSSSIPGRAVWLKHEGPQVIQWWLH